MHMSATPSSQTQDDNQSDYGHLRPKKEKKIEPLSSNSSFGIPGYGVPKADEDLLEELRRKTAALAGEMSAQKSHAETEKKLDTLSDIKADTIRDKESEKSVDNFLEGLKTGSESHQPSTGNDAAGAESENGNPAVSIVREKVARLFEKEPNAKEEIREVELETGHRSKHQQFMYDLTTSGKSLADIQTEWHRYYIELPDNEKHEVWQEFYESQRPVIEHERHEKHLHPHHKQGHKKTHAHTSHIKSHASEPPKRLTPPNQSNDRRTVAEVKAQLMDKISAGGQLTVVHHVKSLVFGLGMSMLVLLIITFVFFNEAYIAPFISPNQTVSATPIIGNQSGPVGSESKIIIPKINLEVPVVFGLDTVDESAIQNALEDGVVHFASSPNPGEVGNSVIVGHSSNNILNKGKYKFAFVLLKRLESEDTFFVQKDGVRYTYKVYKKEIVSPDNVSVLGTQDKPNTITLITCDPPGTSINRLIITAEQIAPDPAGNKASTAPSNLAESTKELPSNSPSLWSRIWPF